MKKRYTLEDLKKHIQNRLDLVKFWDHGNLDRRILAKDNCWYVELVEFVAGLKNQAKTFEQLEEQDLTLWQRYPKGKKKIREFEKMRFIALGDDNGK